MSPLKAKGIESRAKLLEAATHEFAINGYHQTKISDIVRSAGVTQAAFYIYFPSKEAIFTELIIHFMEQLQLLAQNIEKVTPLSPDEVPEQIYNNLKAVFEFLTADTDLTRLAWYESGKNGVIKDLVAQVMTPKIINNQKAGHIRDDLSADILADCIIGMIDYLTEKWLLTNKKEPSHLASEMIQLLLYGALNGQKYNGVIGNEGGNDNEI